MRPTDYELQPAPEFLFERWPDHRNVAREHPTVATLVLVAGTEPSHRASRHNHHVIPRCGASTLTVTSDPANQIVIAANGSDRPGTGIHLRSEQSTVVIDQIVGAP